jgi:N-acetylglutamate synthase
LLQQRIEEVSLNAWPALQSEEYDGWLLKYAHGYTKRANSVNVLSPSAVVLPDKVAFSERFYADRGVPAVFRLTSFNAPPGLDQLLEQRGYRWTDGTQVMALDLTGYRSPDSTGAVLRDEELKEWLKIYTRLSGSDPERQQIHGEILAAITVRRILASLSNAGRIVSCGLGVQEDEYFGLFDLVTDPYQRSRGYGSALINGLLQRAIAEGARHAYLQVLESNSGARLLYERLGFRDVYRYWYRVQAG